MDYRPYPYYYGRPYYYRPYPYSSPAPFTFGLDWSVLVAINSSSGQTNRAPEQR